MSNDFIETPTIQTVGDLIARLQGFDHSLPIRFAVPEPDVESGEMAYRCIDDIQEALVFEDEIWTDLDDGTAELVVQISLESLESKYDIDIDDDLDDVEKGLDEDSDLEGC